MRELVLKIAREEGSTRPIALVRMGVPLIFWARFGSDLTLYARHSLPFAALATFLMIASVAMFLGAYSRSSTGAFTVGLGILVGYYGAVLNEHQFLHHHVSLLFILAILLTLAPAGRSYSFDRWREIRSADDPPAERGPLWVQWLICLQVSAIYLWGAIDKTDAGYLSGDRVEHFILFYHFGSSYPASPLFHPFAQAMAIGSVAFEYFLAVGLWIRRWQRWVVPLGLVFHGLIYVSMPVRTFTATMWLVYVLFLPPDAVHAFIDRISGHKPT